MRVHILQHVPFEGIGHMEPWLRARGASLGHTRFFEAWTLPDPAEPDLIIVMGGPMSVNDESRLPWLVPEKQFIREAIRQGSAVLGVCLGAQLIASACGARVIPAPHREIGWFDIEAVPASGSEPLFRFPSRATVFHWHGETVELPAGAVHLARSAACEHQAFQLGANVIGLQFHLETTPESVAALIEHCGEELEGESAFVQPEALLRAAKPETYEGIHVLLDQVLEFLVARAANRR